MAVFVGRLATEAVVDPTTGAPDLGEAAGAPSGSTPAASPWAEHERLRYLAERRDVDRARTAAWGFDA